MSRKLKSLFAEIENTEIAEYTSLLFNLYEDKKYYTIEACFDDEAFIIGRDDPFVICKHTVPWQKVESEIDSALQARIRKFKDIYKHFESISYGFVDGDLHYIKKPHQKTKGNKHFSADDFKDFKSQKLTAWLSVYLTDEAKEKYKYDMIKMMFSDLKEEQHEYWRKILAENFDYEKYQKLS